MRTRPEILFWDVDTQVDFMRESGALYVPGAEEIVPTLGRLTDSARRAGVPVIASADAVNVDAWIRSWSPSGELLWQQQLSWGDHRDDPIALLSDELGDVFMGGRINANTFEDAMVAKLDGAIAGRQGVGDVLRSFGQLGVCVQGDLAELHGALS